MRLLLDGLLIGSSMLFLCNVLVLDEMFARLGPGLGALVLSVYPWAMSCWPASLCCC